MLSGAKANLKIKFEEKRGANRFQQMVSCNGNNFILFLLRELHVFELPTIIKESALVDSGEISLLDKCLEMALEL